jgi:hypothetical protein
MTAIEKKQREQITKLHDKFYKGKKKSSVQKVNERLAKAGIGIQLVEKAEPVLGNTGKPAGSRADLMAQAQLQGIKNFRVLNKKELTECLANLDDRVKVAAIVVGAVARWKAGWGSKKAAK